MVSAGTEGEGFFRTNYVVRQCYRSCRIAGNGDIPRKLSVGLLPMAGDQSVGCLVAGRSLVEFLHLEVRREVDDLEAGSTGLNAAHVLHAPGDEVAEQHDVVARIHAGIGGVAVPKLPDGGGSVQGHVAPPWIALHGGKHPGKVLTTHVGQSA